MLWSRTGHFPEPQAHRWATECSAEVDKPWEGKWLSADKALDQSPEGSCPEPQTKLHPNMGRDGKEEGAGALVGSFFKHFSLNRPERQGWCAGVFLFK